MPIEQMTSGFSTLRLINGGPCPFKVSGNGINAKVGLDEVVFIFRFLTYIREHVYLCLFICL